MKKICFVLPRAYYLFNENAKNADDKAGGAQKQAFLLSTELAKDNNYDIHFLVADFRQPDFEIINNVKLHKSFSFEKNILSRFIALLKTLKKTNCDLYVFRSADIGVAVAIFFVRFFMNRNTFYMIASDAEINNFSLKKFAGKLSAFAMKYVYKKSELITAQTIKQSQSFFKNRKRKTDAVLKNIFLPLKLESVNTKRKTILWVGRLSEIKNPELFTELAIHFPEENFIMIAPTVVEKKQYGENFKSKIKNIKNLQYFSYIKPSELESYYFEAKIYVMTSEFEGFSNTMAEAMQAECPVLSYNVNPDNILTEYNAGFCADGDKEIFFSKFNEINKNESLRKELGKNGAEYIKANHSADKIISVFKYLIDTK